MSRNDPRGEVTVSPYIDGAASPSGSQAVVEVINPSNGKRELAIPVGCAADVDLAVASARQTFEGGSWSEAPPSLRKRTLHRFSDLIEARGAELDALDAGEMGKPVGEKFGNAMAAAGLVRFYAEAVDKIEGQVFCSDKSSFVAQRRVPRGVVGAIAPWNFPTLNSALKVAPALAAGNCVVLKPSELSSRSALRLAELATEADVPPGVFNVVPGLGETAGQALGLHRDVDMLTFTGSTATGKRMLQYAGQSNMKVVVAECGGKSPHIVFDDDVDLEMVSDSIARHLLINQGQLCSVGSRLLVQRSIESAMVARIAARFKEIAMGDAMDPRTTFGPLASANQFSRVMQFIDGAQSDGARLTTGGRRVLPETGGYFVEPTILQNVAPDAAVAREEIFGPVLAVIPFDDEEHAIRLANHTVFGLTAYVWTASLSTGFRMAKAIRASVWINAAAAAGEGAGFAASFEPAGYSGVGTEGGLAGLESYLRRQLLWFNHA